MGWDIYRPHYIHIVSIIVLARAILLNGIYGTLFGYLYWKRGLESSMMAHFTADLLVAFGYMSGLMISAILGAMLGQRLSSQADRESSLLFLLVASLLLGAFIA